MMLTDNYLTGPKLRARFDGISEMTLWRWLRDEAMGFPQPLRINGRRYFSRQEIEEWEASRVSHEVAR